MTLSDAEFQTLVRAALDASEASYPSSWITELRTMVDTLAEFQLSTRNDPPLLRLCEAGAHYGLQKLEAATDPKLLSVLSHKARQSVARDLRRNLARLTRPCLDLERTSFGLALSALGTPESELGPKLADNMFLGRRVADRLFPLFKKFPVLAKLWSQRICQNCDHVTEVLERFAADRRALSHIFFGGRPMGRIVDIRCRLSDSHNGGRTVTELRFRNGAVIYKPRPGDGELEWFSLLSWMNARGFEPKFKTVRVLRRNGYCWMEHVKAASCKDKAAARRFYQRMGGIIGAAYLLKAVDCHRDNFIASGEDPVLIDADALWHVSPATMTYAPLKILYETGFFPDSDPGSLQSRSSALGRATAGKHLARIGAQPLFAASYGRDIVLGLNRSWRSLLGTRQRRVAVARRLRRLRSRKRRWIYLATNKYTAIREASIQPTSLRSAIEREKLIARLCARTTASPAVIRDEINALKRLDIPYFVRSTKRRMAPEAAVPPASIQAALRHAMALLPVYLK